MATWARQSSLSARTMLTLTKIIFLKIINHEDFPNTLRLLSASWCAGKFSPRALKPYWATERLRKLVHDGGPRTVRRVEMWAGNGPRGPGQVDRGIFQSRLIYLQIQACHNWCYLYDRHCYKIVILFLVQKKVDMYRDGYLANSNMLWCISIHFLSQINKQVAKFQIIQRTSRNLNIMNCLHENLRICILYCMFDFHLQACARLSWTSTNHQSHPYFQTIGSILIGCDASWKSKLRQWGSLNYLTLGVRWQSR